MRSPLNSILAWYRAPEQELLRREAAWFGAWARRPAGFFALAAFVALSVARIGWALAGWMSPELVGRGAGALMWAMPWIAGFCTDSLGLAIVGYLVYRRTLAPLRKGRLAELVLSPIGPRELWPGLLGAPAAAVIAMAPIRIIGFGVETALYSAIQPQLYFSPPEGVELASPLGFAASVFQLSWELGLPICIQTVRSLSLAAFLTAIALPGASAARFAGAGAVWLVSIGRYFRTIATAAQIVMFGRPMGSVEALASVPAWIGNFAAFVALARRLGREPKGSPAGWIAFWLIILSVAASMWSFVSTLTAYDYGEARMAGVWMRRRLAGYLMELGVHLGVCWLALQRLRGVELWNRLCEQAGQD